MTTLERIDRWHASGTIREDQHRLLAALVRRERVSLFVEISGLLYLGVLSLVSGLFWTFREYVINLGDAAILSILVALMAAAFYYCFSRGERYSHGAVESPSMVFDYVLYFGCLVMSSTMGYLESRFDVFQDWTTHLFLASIVFGLLAYRFDNRFVLSLAISTLAGYLGLKISAFDVNDTDLLRLTALAFGGTLGGLGVWLWHQGIKPHFLDTYLHIAGNVTLMSMASGVLEPGSGLLYFGMLLALAAAAIYLGTRFNRFAFVAYGALYGYGGASALLTEHLGGPTGVLWYFVLTGTMVVFVLTVLARRFGRDE